MFIKDLIQTDYGKKERERGASDAVRDHGHHPGQGDQCVTRAAAAHRRDREADYM